MGSAPFATSRCRREPRKLVIATLAAQILLRPTQPDRQVAPQRPTITLPSPVSVISVNRTDLKT